jgi:hypothetical protein
MLSVGDVEWIRQFDGEGSAAVAVSGNIFVAGHELPGNGIGFLKAHDPSGAEVWTRQFASMQSIRSVALTVDTSGIYVAGGDDAFVIKYDYSGNELWSRHSFVSALPLDVAVDATGIYVLAEGTISGVPETRVTKLDHGGNLLWSRFVGFERGKAISVNESGIYTVGSDLDDDLNDTGSVLHRFDLNLQEIWSLQSSANAYDVTVSDTGLFVSGETAGALPGQSNTGFPLDAFLQRYDLDGNLIWTRQFADGAANDVVIDESAAYVAGWLYRVINPGSPFPSRTTDAFVSKFNLDGHEIWRTELASPAGDRAQSVAIDDNGVYAAGRGGDVSGSMTGFEGNFVAKLEPGAIFNVAIDVKPGSGQNSTNLSAQGAIAVAILSTNLAAGDLLEFDATQIDGSSVLFAGAVAFQSALRCRQ